MEFLQAEAERYNYTKQSFTPVINLFTHNEITYTNK